METCEKHPLEFPATAGCVMCFWDLVGEMAPLTTKEAVDIKGRKYQSFRQVQKDDIERLRDGQSEMSRRLLKDPIVHPHLRVKPGQRYGRWQVVHSPNHDGKRTWKVLVRCECGRTKSISVNGLLGGSQGCMSSACKAEWARKQESGV